MIWNCLVTKAIRLRCRNDYQTLSRFKKGKLSVISQPYYLSKNRTIRISEPYYLINKTATSKFKNLSTQIFY